MPERTRFNFVVMRDEAEIRRLVDGLSAQPDDAARAEISASGELAWSLQSFMILRKRGRLDVSCSGRIDADAVNLVHSDAMLHLAGPARSFVVCLRADYPKREWANHHIVQNKDQLGRGSDYLCHWVQSGLLPRSQARRRIETVAYVGQVERNLAGSVDAWRDSLSRHGIAFVVPPRERWHDMRDFDVLIGIRSFDGNRHPNKPPSKLVNAWHARIPFIGGNDSAFRQVGTPEQDYLVAATSDAALDQVLRLQREPGLYAAIVANGVRKAEIHDNEAIALDWEKLLEGPIAAKFAAWKVSRLEPVRFAASLAAGLAMHHSRRIGRLALGTVLK